MCVYIEYSTPTVHITILIRVPVICKVEIAHIPFFPFHSLSTEYTVCLQESCSVRGAKVLQGENATAEQCCRDEGFPRVRFIGAECNVCSKLIPSLCAIVPVTLHVHTHTHTHSTSTQHAASAHTHTHTNTVCYRGNGLLCPHTYSQYRMLAVV